MAEAHMPKLVFDGPGQRTKLPMHGLEFAWGRTLEGEDRLFLVADREDRPPDGARAGAGKKFSAEAPDDLPLLRAGVLCLVDENMIDTLIEFVVHPRRALFPEQR